MPPRPRSNPRELIAQRVVQQVLNALPENLRAEADRCVIDLASVDPQDADLLGLFEGNARNDPEPQSAEELPRITLFLTTLWDYADRDVATFREEVKTTLLHELGHYLGLDEEGVATLGLA